MSSLVQTSVLESVQNVSGGTIPLGAWSSGATTTGNTMIAVFSWDTGGSPAISGVTDGTNTFTQMTGSPIIDTTSGQGCGFWIKTGITGAAGTITATISPATVFRSGCAVELDGVDSYTVEYLGSVTNHGSATNASNGMSDGTGTPSVDNCTIIAVGDIHQDAVLTAGTGWTQDVRSGVLGPVCSILRRDQTTAASVTGQWTPSGIASPPGSFNARIFALAPAAAPFTGGGRGFIRPGRARGRFPARESVWF